MQDFPKHYITSPNLAQSGQGPGWPTQRAPAGHTSRVKDFMDRELLSKMFLPWAMILTTGPKKKKKILMVNMDQKMSHCQLRFCQRKQLLGPPHPLIYVAHCMGEIPVWRLVISSPSSRSLTDLSHGFTWVEGVEAMRAHLKKVQAIQDELLPPIQW